MRVIFARHFVLQTHVRIQQRWKSSKNNEFGNPVDLRSNYERHVMDINAGKGSRHNDPNAPIDREERKAWLKKKLAGYENVGKSTKQQEIERRSRVRTEGEYILKSTGKYDALMKDEENYLSKRKKELEERGQKILLGVGVLLTCYVVYTIVNLLTERPPQHPAATCFIGTTVEIKLKIGEHEYKKPILIGLFTQRAPAASANLIRLVESGKLIGTEFFKIDKASLYGGVTAGGDARDGIVDLPGDELQFLPYEDSELPPFKYCVVSCARAFHKNSGMTSVFGILLADNPKTIGNLESRDYFRVAQHNHRGTVAAAITGRRRLTTREELDPYRDGSYVFATVIEGKDVLNHIIATTKSLPPSFRPTVEVTVADCKVVDKNLPGKLEAESSKLKIDPQLSDRKLRSAIPS